MYRLSIDDETQERVVDCIKRPGCKRACRGDHRGPNRSQKIDGLHSCTEYAKSTSRQEPPRRCCLPPFPLVSLAAVELRRLICCRTRLLRLRIRRWRWRRGWGRIASGCKRERETDRCFYFCSSWLSSSERLGAEAADVHVRVPALPPSRGVSSKCIPNVLKYSRLPM